MKLEKKVKKKLEDLGIFLLSGFLIGIATYNFASAFSFSYGWVYWDRVDRLSFIWDSYRYDCGLLKYTDGSYFMENTRTGVLEKVYTVYCKCCFFYRLYCTIVSENILEKRFWQFCVQRLYQELVML